MNYRHRLIAGTALIAAGLGMALVSASDAATEHPGKTLYSFAGAPDGENPNGDLIVDAMGVYYGTTSSGGVITTDCPAGCGTVYKVVNGEESVLYSFTGMGDGAVPYDGLLLDAEGNLFGVTRVGGDSGLGTVFELAPDGTKSTLHSFAGGSDDGASPNGDLIADADGNLYGTTFSGGIGSCSGGCGAVFKITPDGEESVLYAFAGSPRPEGANPAAGLIADAEGNLYGTTFRGGKPGCGQPTGCGTIFKLTPDGQESVLHEFEGRIKAGHPSDRLLVDAQGNFYGTSYNGGQHRFGAVWQVSPDGATETVLWSFHHHADGVGVGSGLIADSEGNLYGTTAYGGENQAGIVYRVTPEGQFATLYTFPGAIHYNSAPSGRLLLDHRGNLIGTTIFRFDGNDNRGTIFEVKN